VHPPTDEPAVPSMVRITGGAVDLRDDRLGTRWRAEIASFLLGRYPVTAHLHRAVTGTDLNPSASGASPVTNVSWLDAVDVCNQLSARLGLDHAYSRDTQSGEVTCDWASTGYRLPTDAESPYVAAVTPRSQSTISASDSLEPCHEVRRQARTWHLASRRVAL